MTDLDVIFADNHLLVVNKPAGLLTQPSGTDQDSLEAWAKNWIKLKYNKPGNVFLEAVHRLDRPVSGLVLFARTSKALSRLQAAMREKQYVKTYLAVVEGVPKIDSGVLEHYLIHDDYQAKVVSQSTPQAKIARLSYCMLKSEGQKALLEITLETGRYHQIRVQLAAIGHPVLGDTKYGSLLEYIPGAIALHHYRMQVPHPVTGLIHTFEAPSCLLKTIS